MANGKRTECRHCSETFVVGSRSTCPMRPNHVHEPNTILCDNDWDYKLRLGKTQAKALIRAIMGDTDFLQSMGIMDYSLLLGIHRSKYKLVGVWEGEGEDDTHPLLVSSAAPAAASAAAAAVSPSLSTTAVTAGARTPSAASASVALSPSSSSSSSSASSSSNAASAASAARGIPIPGAGAPSSALETPQRAPHPLLSTYTSGGGYVAPSSVMSSAFSPGAGALMTNPATPAAFSFSPVSSSSGDSEGGDLALSSATMSPGAESTAGVVEGGGLSPVAFGRGMPEVPASLSGEGGEGASVSVNVSSGGSKGGGIGDTRGGAGRGASSLPGPGVGKERQQPASSVEWADEHGFVEDGYYLGKNHALTSEGEVEVTGEPAGGAGVGLAAAFGGGGGGEEYAAQHPSMSVPKSNLFSEYRGGLRATIVEGPGIYYLGIIDVLQEWTLAKRLENWFKTHILCTDTSGLSAVDPERYAKRFSERVLAQLIEGHILRYHWEKKREASKMKMVIN